jgi:hypothetical protein
MNDLGELGGSVNLYVSFTLMALWETLAFILSSQVRHEVSRHELVLESRRNPRIIAPKLYNIFKSLSLNLILKFRELVSKIKRH